MLPRLNVVGTMSLQYYSHNVMVPIYHRSYLRMWCKLSGPALRSDCFLTIDGGSAFGFLAAAQNWWSETLALDSKSSSFASGF